MPRRAECRCQWVVDALECGALTLAAKQNQNSWLMSTPDPNPQFALKSDLVLVRHGLAQIHHRQQHKNIGLDQCDADVQPHENYGDSNRDQRKEYESHHVSREHVGKETDVERKNSRQVAAYLDDEYQRRQPPHRTQEVLDVSRAIGTDTTVVIVNP